MMDALKQTIFSYDRTAAEYTANVAGMHHQSEFNRFCNFISKHSIVLDLGCGSGRDAKIFSEKGYDVVGADLSGGMIEHAKHYAPQADFTQMDMRQLGFADETFDGVWCVASMLHLPKKDMPHALCEANRVLNYCGVFYIAVKQGFGEGLEADARYGEGINKFFSYYQPEELEAMLSIAGFSKIEGKTAGWQNEYQKKPEIRVLCSKM